MTIRRWAFAWAWSIGAVLACGCPKPVPPVPTPTPPPPDTGPKYTDMLLRKCSATDPRFCASENPIQFRGAIPCCSGSPGARWPLAGSGFIDWAQAQGEANFFHGRPGPYLSQHEPNSLARLVPLPYQYTVDERAGGAYVETGGKADLAQWNEKFWAFLASDVDYAGAHGANYEVDVIDSWRLKGTCDWSPWKATNNVQGENHCITTHRGPGDAVADAFIHKLVQTAGRFGNVIWQIGNESSQVAGKNAGLLAWEKWVADRVRFWEQQVGYGIVHMIGTNSEFDEIENAGFIDYVNIHNRVPTAPHFNKPTTDNEANPQGTAAALVGKYCQAFRGKAYFWGWRAELEEQEYVKALAGIRDASKNNCSALPPIPDNCPAPDPNPADLKWNYMLRGSWWDPTPVVTRNCAYCSATGQGDGGTRCECPARVECPGFQCESRVACEQVLMQAPAPIWRGDGNIEISESGWMARCYDCSWLSVCNGPQTKCQRVIP